MLQFADAAQPRRAERRGIEYIPHAERKGRPSHLRWMWAGGIFNVQMVAFGAIVPMLGLNFEQSVAVILIGNLSWFAAGLTSLPGPAAGTTGFVVQRSAFGLRGAKIPNALNWVTQVLFEISSFVLASTVLVSLAKLAGLPDSPVTTIGCIFVAAVLQFILPAFGHAMIVKALQVLLVPFFICFVVLGILTIPQVSLGTQPPADFAVLTQGLGFVFAAGGFSWMANGSDFARYLPQKTSRWGIVWNVAIGGAIPMTLLMILGAAISTIGDGAAADPIGGLPSIFPTWFVVPYLIFAAAQLFALTSLDLYSSGVALQSLGVKVSRFVAIAIDLVLCSVVAAIAIFSGSVYAFISNSLLFIMVWLGGWGGILIVDYMLRRGHYSSASLFAKIGGVYWSKNGFNPAGLISLAAGFVCSLSWINTTIFVGPISSATGGSDFSTPVGFIVGGGLYFILGRREVAKQLRDGANEEDLEPVQELDSIEVEIPPLVER